MPILLRRRSLLGAGLAALLISPLSAPAADGDKPDDKPRLKTVPVTALKLDTAAAYVDFFDGQESGDLSVRIIAKDEKGGNLVVANHGDEPVTVQIPDGIVGVHVQNQFGGGGFGGGGAFSIPPQTAARIPYTSVCLEYGKPEPRPRMTYEVRKLEDVIENETLRELIILVGSGKLNEEAAQAAAWHLADDMSWVQLANLKRGVAGGPDVPLFNARTLFGAQRIVAESVRRAELRREGRTAAAR
ncbi:hypothetical protein [Alienimonas chondri]|uniref:Uncharacterized protein n=1 Tax=Alienimonas chondri TaxID=2681879 RepID=A0ABX1VHC2_9PLAN|nr:hypothetical protein [Alienimonas chondri]NNJ26885.1 hypothetical protein [Alienimonas chondri]